MENKKDNGELILKIVAISLVVLAIVGAVLYVVLNQPKPHDNLDTAFAGKYELESIKGLEDKGVTKDSYEYNYILLKADGHYEIKNKINKKKTSKKGVWYVEDGKVHFESRMMLGFVKTHDEGEIKNGTITMRVANESSEIVMILKKKA